MNPLSWYTPAESWHPWSEILGAVTGADDDLARVITQACAQPNVALAADARSLMYRLLVALNRQDADGRDVVVLPAYTCYTVAAAVIKAGLRIRLYDMHSKDLSAQMESLRAAVREDTLAVISQHLFGMPTDVMDIQGIARQAACWHIEDAAQAFGSYRGEHMAGTTGDFGLYSFGRGKALAVGGGAALVSAQTIPIPAMTDTAGSMVDASKTIVTAIAAQPLCYGLMERLPLGLGETHFDTSFTPAALSPYLSRLAVSAAARLESLRDHRMNIAQTYRQQLATSTMKVADTSTANYTRFPVIATSEPIPASLYQLGVRRMYPRALIDVDEVRRDIVEDQAPVTGAQQIAEALVTLPTHRRITRDIAGEIASGVNRWLA